MIVGAESLRTIRAIKLVALANAGDNDRRVLAEAKAFIASN